jgi:hypothetical protein
MWPLDPQSGGTWIGMNDAGIAMAVLNRTVAGDRRPANPPASRGTVVPRLLRQRTLHDVKSAAMDLPLHGCEPFTLVAVSRQTVVSMVHDGRNLTFQSSTLSTPLLFTSSSLGDHIVITPRRQLFAALVERGAAPRSGQLAFHCHWWPDRPEISVRMSRPDAATVSRTIVDVASNRLAIHYTAIKA